MPMRGRMRCMSALANLLIALIALEHLWFLVLEMFLWTGPIGRKTFRLDPGFAQKSKPLAMNMGLYNGFLAAGLFWSLQAAPELGLQLKYFFLGCVTVAGIFGGMTVNQSIMVVQALPAALALVALTFAVGV